MSLSTLFEDRGFGRVYVAFEAHVGEGVRLRARAAGPDGAELPCVVTRSPRPGIYVLIAPELAFAYTVEVRAEGPSGPVERLRYEITPAFTRHAELPSSQRFACGLDDVRYVDMNPLGDAAWVGLERLVNFEDGTDVARGEVVALFPEGVAPADPALLVLDERGEVRGEGLVLHRELEERPGAGTVGRYQYAIHVSRELDAFTLWARFASERIQDGFMVGDAQRVSALRWDWWRLMDATPAGSGYARWYQDRGRTPERDLAVQARLDAADGPRFSVITPVFNPPLDVLDEAVASVLRQTYPNFELVLVNACPENTAIDAYLIQCAARDERVSVVSLEGNRGITANTWAGVAASSGDYLCFFDHDDLLEPNALFEYARAIRAHPGLSLLYCDEDLLVDGRFQTGYFKPDFDPELLAHHNYVTHLLCVSRETAEGFVRERGVPGKEIDGAQDYALTLYAGSHGRAWHVRKTLYHWRSSAASVATNASAKEWVNDIAEHVLERHFEAEGIRARLAPGPQLFMFEHAYEVPGGTAVSCVVLRTADDDAAERCVASVLASAGSLLAEVLVVDPFGSYRPDGAVGEGSGRVRVVDARGASGVAARRNLGAREASGAHLVFLDDRCEASDASDATDASWLERLVGPLCQGVASVAGAGLFYADGLARHLGICLPEGIPLLPRLVNHLIPPTGAPQGYYTVMTRFSRSVSAVSGSALAIGAGLFRSLGGFDEGYACGFDDVDLCLRVRERSERVVVVPEARLTYHGKTESSRVVPPAFFGQRGAPGDPEAALAIQLDQALFAERWCGYFASGDPFYSERLYKENGHYQLFPI